MAARRRPRKKGEPTSLGDLVRNTPAGRAAVETVVSRRLWEEVAGVGFARRTRPTRIHRGTLYIQVASAGWAQELALAERVLLERLRGRGVAVERLRYEVVDVDAPDRGGVYAPRREEVERARALDLPPEAARAVAKVQDPTLRELMAKTARAVARRQAEVDLRASAAGEARAIPRVPGKPVPPKPKPKPEDGR